MNQLCRGIIGELNAFQTKKGNPLPLMECKILIKGYKTGVAGGMLSVPV